MPLLRIMTSVLIRFRHKFRLQGYMATAVHGYLDSVKTKFTKSAAIGRLSSCEILKWPPLIIIGCVTYAPLSGVYECPLCSHGPRGPVGV